MLLKVFSYFIPAKPIADDDYLRRKRLVAMTIFITALFALFYVCVSWLTGYRMGMIIMFCNFLADLVLLILLRRGLNAIKAANIFGFVCSFSILGCIYYSGGIYSPVFPWLAEPPIVILLIAGKKSGSFWLALTLLMALVLGYMSYNEYVFPKGYAESAEIFFFICCYTGLIMIIFLTSIVFESFRINAYKAVTEQNEELASALTALKSTQTQLIQSEKMASLGELTAGIAHEIQNPLNFVNNFSEVSMELIEEVKSEKLKAKSERNEELENELLDDISQNLQKIAHHGKRADFIVKGMLQHSRTRTDEKQLTNINTLAEEFLKLSYHGLRAKDKSFNAELVTNFDENLPQISVVQQDIGRVLLNLFNNAFYAVNKRAKSKEQGIKNNEEYKPVVEVSTSIKDGFVVITVKDNGIGIPEAIKEKIMQPFFTTKPTGEGTGLGLSLSYDIVKAHGGELTVETKEGYYSEFLMQLPIT